MSKWNEIKNNIARVADKAVQKTDELADIAALKLSIVGKESTRDSEYKKLGKLIYEKLQTANSEKADILTEQISETIKKLDALIDEIEKLEIELKKATSGDGSKKKHKFSKNISNETDPQIMKQFSEARVVANQKYEEAEQATEYAKMESEDAQINSKQVNVEGTALALNTLNKAIEAQKDAEKISHEAQKKSDQLK